MTLIVHGAWISPFVRKVRAALHEKSLDYELVDLITFPKTPELLALSPLGKMPVFEDTAAEFSIPDSSVICAYLERVHPEPRLYPDDPRDLARALWLEEYSDTKLLEGVGLVGRERVIKPQVFQVEADESLVKDALTNLIPPVFDYLEGQLDEGADTLLPALSIADLAVGCQLQFMSLAGEEIDSSRWPRLAHYSASLLARPSFQKAAS
jgi:glutathione S-transferase